MTDEIKAVNVSISDDLDPWEMGDLVAFVGWDGGAMSNGGLMTTGDAYLGVIQAINDQIATVEFCDSFFNCTGNTCLVPLSQLREYNLPGTQDTQDDLAALGNPDAPETNDDVAASKAASGSDPEDFAYVPDKKSPSTWKLDISDFDHACMAAQAITEGFRGNKVDIPGKKLAAVKTKIKWALNKWATSDDKDRKQQWLDALDGKSSDASKSIEQIVTSTVIEIDRPSGAIKALDDECLKIGGYLVQWGDRQHKDLTGEYFTKSTDFALDWYEQRPILYHHGQNSGTGITAIGWIKAIEPDDIGLWAEGELTKRNRYVKAVQDLVRKGALAWSSGSLKHLVQKRGDGEITRWPLVEGSMTPQPAEPRDTGIMPIKSLWDAQTIGSAFKALNLPVEKLQLPTPEDEHEDAQESVKPVNAPAEAVKTVSGEVPHDDPKSTVEETEMVAQPLTPETVADIAAQAAVKAVGEYIKLLPPPVVPAKPEDDAKKNLSLSGLPVPDSHDGGFHLTVADEAKYNDMDSSDVAMMYMMLNGAANAENAGLRSDFGRMSKRIIDGIHADEAHKMERRIAAKAIREWTYSKNSKAAESILTGLPFKSLGDVDANNYKRPELVLYENRPGDQWAMKSYDATKANELDYSTQANAVADWVNNLWSETIIRRKRISNPMLDLLTQVTMPTNPFYLPIESTDPTVYYMKEGTDAAQLVLTNGANTVDLSKASSNKLTLTATKMGARLGFSTETQEDALPFTVPQFNYQMKRIIQNAIDYAIINGDTATGASTNINIIDGTPGSTAGSLPRYLTLNGIRKFGLVTNTGQLVRFAGPPTLALFRSMRFTLAAQYALDLPNLAYVVDYKTYFKMLSMPEFLTYQNLGAMGSNVTGLLPMGKPDQLSDTAQPVGMIDGINIYVSAEIGLAQTGLYSAGGGQQSTTGSNNTTGTAILVDKSRWFVGFRRGVEVQSFGLPYFSDTVQMVAMVRLALASFDTTCAVIGYDITVS